MKSISSSAFDNIPDIQFDPIVEILDRYSKCQDSDKINLTIGAYRDENLQTVVFECVKKAEDLIISENFSRAYLPPT
jgi:hypothetical protein